MSGARHDIAARARDHLFRVSDGCGGAIQYRHSDAQLVDFSDATHLYIASLCFPAAVVAAIAERIRTGHAPDLQVRLAHCLDCGVTVVPNRKASHTEGSQQSARSAALCVCVCVCVCARARACRMETAADPTCPDISVCSLCWERNRG